MLWMHAVVGRCKVSRLS